MTEAKTYRKKNVAKSIIMKSLKNKIPLHAPIIFGYIHGFRPGKKRGAADTGGRTTCEEELGDKEGAGGEIRSSQAPSTVREASHEERARMMMN